VPSAVIAVGGNSLIRAGEQGTVAEQLANAGRTAEAIVQLIRHDYRVVVTHGNGPQVGAALLRSEQASHLVAGQPLDVCDALTQGEIGYLLQQSLYNALRAAGLQREVVTVLSQVVVAGDDPAMARPEKPIGPFYSQADAEEKRLKLGWAVVEDAGRGYRRVVPSPTPVAIVEENVIRQLLGLGVILIALGGGGIPVVREGDALKGVEAVIDKDRASALLATRLGVDRFIISTDVQAVCLDFKKKDQRSVGRISVADLESHLRDGQFGRGSMAPKVESAIRFARESGREAIITSCEHLWDAVHGTAGTHVIP